MKRLISWLVVAVVGLALMAFPYYRYEYEPGESPWDNVFMYLGAADPNCEVEGLEYVRRPVRLLPLAGRAQNFTRMAKSFGSKVESSYRITFQEKVIFYSDMEDDFTPEMLEWGRLPAGGKAEVLAGFATSSRDEINVDGRPFKIVGLLKKGISVFANSYLVGEGAAAEELFVPDEEAIQNAYILRLPKEQQGDLETRKQLKGAFPRSQFTGYAPLIRTQPAAFFIYVGGLALLCSGGCLALFTLYCILADRIRNKWLRLPLAEIRRYKHLFITMNLIYFGAVVVFMLVSYAVPELQSCFLVGVSSQITEGSGILGIAGEAYASKNILRAAVTTFAINFPLGSLACITFPSVIVPGAGSLIAGLRASLWGLLLAPTFDALSGMMVPHSVTLLLEGHGYVIAAFFGVLVLVYLFRKAEGPSAGTRYGRALLMNIRGNLLVIIVLAVAAVYEAIEVILVMLWAGR
ncbi:MAG TPA: hypothetical protein HPP66_06840 [Planctomycetes bacterium]|nr:hypothetical protein [Planctomycetota bacterium]